MTVKAEKWYREVHFKILSAFDIVYDKKFF